MKAERMNLCLTFFVQKQKKTYKSGDKYNM